ncbi:MAG: DUF2797 domain-containing protein [Luteibaculum sp.]
MEFEGIMKKMPTESVDGEVQYFYPNTEKGLINELLGQQIRLKFLDKISCLNCGNTTKKTFGDGMCYKCFSSAPEAAPCIIRPELCEAHLGKGRDIEWEENHHNQPHVVYLALSSSIKVGVTRAKQIPYRWLDQGANAAIILAEVPYRQLAGEIEVFLKDFYTDKTSWQAMLKNHVSEANLLDEKDDAAGQLPEELQDFISERDEVFEFKYPVLEYPSKTTSVKLDKMPEFHGILSGIKGQYWMFSDGRVINWRNHGGYHVAIEKSKQANPTLF